MVFNKFSTIWLSAYYNLYSLYVQLVLGGGPRIKKCKQFAFQLSHSLQILLFQIEEENPELLTTGEVFYEPKNQPILHFLIPTIQL